MLKPSLSAIALLLLGGTVAGGVAAQGNRTAGGGNAVQGGGGAAAAFTSSVAAVRIAPLAVLPRAPADAGEGDCSHLLQAPRSAAGRMVANKGWKVTAEQSIGRYQAVSFVGRVEQGTSGSCLLDAGNIALFEGTTLRAIVHGADGNTAAVGHAEPVEGGALRIWNGDFLSQPVADLAVGANGGATVTAPAPEERVCRGKGAVPNIYGMPIDKARAALGRAGWTPVRADMVPTDPRAADLIRHGVIEAEDCSGTGFGYCGFAYRGAAGRLSVTTVGDAAMPEVSGYGVTCGGG
ncbi:PASTA domain-containing protein [Sphingomonas sanxanigenens]|uniref:PASTA domain-containing protein n=1 Tax=Sphingomonas sanxanigenens TaxID=397260 RepID=UPI0004B7A9F3|nr:PASTA domain-containing protein [Sphingomonas sanxanigenens]